MPYKDREKQLKYMRDHQKRKKVKVDKLTEDFEKAKKIIQEEFTEKKRLKKENVWLKLSLEAAVKLFYKVHLIARDPSLTHKERTCQIENIPIPLGLIPILNRMTKTIQLEIKKNE